MSGHLLGGKAAQSGHPMVLFVLCLFVIILLFYLFFRGWICGPDCTNHCLPFTLYITFSIKRLQYSLLIKNTEQNINTITYKKQNDIMLNAILKKILQYAIMLLKLTIL